MTTQPLLEETHGHVRVLRLNRPEKRNPLSTETTSALIAGVANATAEPEVRVVAITGSGGSFCAGADLSPRQPSDPPPPSIEETAESVVELVRGMRVDCTKPVIAGIDGIAIGAGLSLAMAADIRVASSAARFHPGYTRLATSPDVGLTWTLPAAIGRERALRFLLEQEEIDAQVALALGLIGEVLDVEGFDDAFLGYCRRIAEVAPFAATETKRLFNQADPPPDLEAHLLDELRTAARGLMSEDGREARRALREKRTPTFGGRR